MRTSDPRMGARLIPIKSRQSKRLPIGDPFLTNWIEARQRLALSLAVAAAPCLK